MRMTTGFKKLMGVAATTAIVMTALAADAALVYNLTGKVIDSCSCKPIGGRLVCAGTCQAVGQCCCCTRGPNR